MYVCMSNLSLLFRKSNLDIFKVVAEVVFGRGNVGSGTTVEQVWFVQCTEKFN